MKVLSDVPAVSCEPSVSIGKTGVSSPATFADGFHASAPRKKAASRKKLRLPNWLRRMRLANKEAQHARPPRPGHHVPHRPIPPDPRPILGGPQSLPRGLPEAASTAPQTP